MAEVPAESESQGILERAKERYKYELSTTANHIIQWSREKFNRIFANVCTCVCREMKVVVVDAGSTAFEFIHMYYEDHVKPVTDKYTEWAEEKATAFWAAIKDRVSSNGSG